MIIRIKTLVQLLLFATCCMATQVVAQQAPEGSGSFGTYEWEEYDAQYQTYYNVGQSITGTELDDTIFIREIGDCNSDGVVDFLDIATLISILSLGDFSEEADINRDGTVDFFDIGAFVSVLSNGGGAVFVEMNGVEYDMTLSIGGGYSGLRFDVVYLRARWKRSDHLSIKPILRNCTWRIWKRGENSRRRWR